MPAVSDSSPLIFLAAIDHVALLPALYGEIIVPEAVWRETVDAGAGRAGAAEMEDVAWIRRGHPSEVLMARLRAMKLGRGEAEAIAMAVDLQPRVPILLDDLRARRMAMESGLTVTGTGGLLVAAKVQDLIPAFTPLLDAVRSAGLYVDHGTVRRLTKLARED